MALGSSESSRGRGQESAGGAAQREGAVVRGAGGAGGRCWARVRSGSCLLSANTQFRGVRKL